MIYIKNKGITQTSISGSNTQKTVDELKWDAKYDGKNADIKVDYNKNGVKRKYELELNNDDLNKILNMANSRSGTGKRTGIRTGTSSGSRDGLYERIQNDFLNNPQSRKIRSRKSSRNSRSIRSSRNSRSSQSRSRKSR